MLAVSPVIMLKPKLGQTRRETANLDSIACSTESRERSLKRTLKVCFDPENRKELLSTLKYTHHLLC